MKNAIGDPGINDFISYRRANERNKKEWQNRWKDRKGKQTARGWNGSPEWFSFLASQRRRQLLLLRRNPSDYADNIFRIEGRPIGVKRPFYQEDEFSDIEVYNSLFEVETILERSQQIADRFSIPLKAYMRFRGLYVSGFFSGRKEIRRALVDEIAEWRKEQKEIERGGKENSFVIRVSGRWLGADTRQGLFSYISLKSEISL